LQSKLKEKGLPWEKAKAFDGSAVVGNFVDKSDLDMSRIRFQLVKNGELVQDGDSTHMLWSIDEIISYVSQFFTLKIGDLIFTGTPAGVGKVAPDDVLEGSLEGKRMFEVRVK
ncbi:MAG: fumarylacetoacetate hydrolase family protein, partial [Lutimonas sp.]